MNRRERLLVGAVGAVGLTGALALVVLPELGGRATSSLVALVGNGYVLAAGVAAAALLVAVVALGLRGVGGVNRATPPDPESVQDAPYPGVRFDRAVDRTSWNPFGRRAERDAVRQRVREAAIRSVIHREGVSRERAEERVESGAWTDDAAAAAFCSDAEHRPLTTRLVAFLRGSRFDRDARRAVAELARREGVARERDGDGDAGEPDGSNAANGPNVADGPTGPNRRSAATDGGRP